MNIIEKLDDLIHQATHERSHYYTAEVLAEAKAKIAQAQGDLARAQAALRQIGAEVRHAWSPTDTDLRIDRIATAILTPEPPRVLMSPARSEPDPSPSSPALDLHRPGPGGRVCQCYFWGSKKS